MRYVEGAESRYKQVSYCWMGELETGEKFLFRGSRKGVRSLKPMLGSPA